LKEQQCFELHISPSIAASSCWCWKVL